MCELLQASFTATVLQIDRHFNREYATELFEICQNSKIKKFSKELEILHLTTMSYNE